MADDALTAAITEALAAASVRVQVPHVGTVTGILRDEAANDLAEQVAQVVREHTAAPAGPAHHPPPRPPSSKPPR